VTALLSTPLPRLVAKATGFRLSPMQHGLLAVGTGLRVEKMPVDVRAAAQKALGYERGPKRPPRVLFANCGARSGKTMLSSYLATHRALVCDLSGMAPGEECRVAFISASMRQARAGAAYAKGFVRALGLGALITSERRDSFTIRRDGHVIEFSVVRGNVGGDALAGFWYPACCVLEAAIAVDPSSGGSALDLDAVEKAVRPRLLPARGDAPGGLIIQETTSRDAAGPAFDRVNDHHGHPDAPITVFRATTLELRPDDQPLREHVEAERATDPTNAAREFDCEWISSGTSGYVFGHELVEPAIDDAMPLALEPVPHVQAWAGCDLAFTGDGSALAIVRQANATGFELASLRRWKPTKRTPLTPSAVVGELLDECQRHGVRLLFCDVHHRETLVEHARARRGIQVVHAPGGSAGKESTHADAQEMLGSGRFKMGRDHKLIRSLQRITATRTPDGAIRIRSPRRKGDHGDDASALVLALNAAFRHGRGGDPLPASGRVSLMQQQLGLCDAQGRRLTEGATQFAIDEASGRARAVPATQSSPFHNPSAGSYWSRQRCF
jgi:hypothetical protein